MVKTNTPLLGLGARGTLGNAITFQKKGTLTMVRKKPTPTYRQTLLQLYQRWLYEDYAYLWRQQTTATQAEYRAAGGRFHLTAFQYWMKYNLLNTPDIIGMWHLDEKTGAVAHDSGRKGNNGIIIGASPTDGIIDGAQFFDGINDWITVPNAPIGHITLPFTVEAIVKLNPLFSATGIIVRKLTNFGLFVLGTRQLGMNYHDGTTWRHFFTGTFLALNTWYRLTALWEAVGANTRQTVYLSENLTATQVFAGQPVYEPLDLSIGATYHVPTEEFYGIFDEVRLYDRLLDPTEITRHSERRYPL